MGKPKKPAGTWVERELFTSQAFCSLKGFAPQLLILFFGKRDFGYSKDKKGNRHYKCLNGDWMHFTYIEAQTDYGITKPRFARAIDDLLAKGFISIEYRGGLYTQDKSAYSLSDKWRLWREGIVFEKREKDNLHRGYRNGKKTKVANKTVPIHTNENVP